MYTRSCMFLEWEKADRATTSQKKQNLNINIKTTSNEVRLKSADADEVSSAPLAGDPNERILTPRFSTTAQLRAGVQATLNSRGNFSSKLLF